MNRDKMLEIIDDYRSILSSYGVEIPKCGERRPLNHCLWMLNKVDEFINDGNEINALKWMGFVQGCFWCFDLRSFDEVNKDNTSD